MECWFWNIDRPMQSYFRSELDHGRLRQGWGYDQKLDLRKIKAKIETPSHWMKTNKELGAIARACSSTSSPMT